LWVRGLTLLESTDRAVTWRSLIPDEASDEATAFDRAHSLTSAIVISGAAGLAVVSAAGLRWISRAPCVDSASDGKNRSAALCGSNLYRSDDGAQSFRQEAAAPRARSLVWGAALKTSVAPGLALTAQGPIRLTPEGVFDEDGKLLLDANCSRLRRSDEAVFCWSANRVWLSGDDGRRWQELEDAIAYHIYDVTDDGAGGAFAATDVGVVHFAAPTPPREARSRMHLPDVGMLLDFIQAPRYRNVTALLQLSVPLERSALREPAGDSSNIRVLHQHARMRAARYRATAERILASATRIIERGLRHRRMLHAEELAAQAAAIIEAAP
jgi:hypothetical protein